MFTKVLVANRAEIALRVIRTLNDMGIASVAVYNEADALALHVRRADEAYLLAGSSLAETYLNPEQIAEIAKRCGADAIHPGYGFLAENPALSRATTAAGLVFIGPRPETMEEMGSKLTARACAMDAGIPVVPGTSNPVNDAGEIIAFGNEFGWPVAVKASFGGGGRGMVVIHEKGQAISGLDKARREAMASFGRDEAYLERYLERPRHLEVQILGDSFGNCIAIGERDCSLQRRHQKLIEEAPAPELTSKVRFDILEDAERLARHARYEGAGTIEMLYEDGRHYFLEMNTRIQVEHPVTELVAGIDIVEAQLRLASGEPLWFGREDVIPRGHAIEARINAEDPTRGAFLPSPGKITRLQLPSGPGVRVDAGYEQGDTLDPQFDSLLAKIIAWGDTRDQARRRLLRALAETHIEGIATTTSAAQFLLGEPAFVHATHSTRTVEVECDLSVLTPPASPDKSERTSADDSGSSEVLRTVDAEVDGRRYQVRIWLPDSSASALVGQASNSSNAKNRRRHRPQDSADSADAGTITVPMQGTVMTVLVSKGDTVEAGQVICVLEAMKMENPISTPISGTITELRVTPGASLGPGDVVATVR